MIQRIIGIITFNIDVYEEIEADENATSQAAIVVAIVAIVGGLVGGGVSAALGGSFIGSFIQTLVLAFISWFLWSYVTYFVSNSLFGGQSDIGQMLRVIGFAQAPGILAIIPVCGGIVGSIWSAVCVFFAVRQGLDLDNGKAIGTAVIGFIVVFLVGAGIGLVLAALGLTAGVTLDAIGG